MREGLVAAVLPLALVAGCGTTPARQSEDMVLVAEGVSRARPQAGCAGR
jgi:hypothetical protein